nr:hypothetical protein [Tanacetum cinerariifolium]
MTRNCISRRKIGTSVYPDDGLYTMGSNREWCYLAKTHVVEGVTKEMHITTAEEKAQRRLEVKARSTLMM